MPAVQTITVSIIDDQDPIAAKKISEVVAAHGFSLFSSDPLQADTITGGRPFQRRSATLEKSIFDQVTLIAELRDLKYVSVTFGTAQSAGTIALEDHADLANEFVETEEIDEDESILEPA